MKVQLLLFVALFSTPIFVSCKNLPKDEQDNKKGYKDSIILKKLKSMKSEKLEDLKIIRNPEKLNLLKDDTKEREGKQTGLEFLLHDIHLSGNHAYYPFLKAIGAAPAATRSYMGSNMFPFPFPFFSGTYGSGQSIVNLGQGTGAQTYVPPPSKGKRYYSNPYAGMGYPYGGGCNPGGVGVGFGR